MEPDDLMLKLLFRFQNEGVEYVLVGGQAIRLNGFLRATEDVDVLVKSSFINGQKMIKALSFLAASQELDPHWFEPNAQGEVENIRIADDLLVDVLFAANGYDYDSMLPFVSTLTIENIEVRLLNIDGLLKTKTDYREKDLIDKSMLLKLKQLL